MNYQGEENNTVNEIIALEAKRDEIIGKITHLERMIFEDDLIYCDTCCVEANIDDLESELFDIERLLENSLENG